MSKYIQNIKMNLYKINLFISFLSLFLVTIYLLFFTEINISYIIPSIIVILVLLLMGVLLKVKSK
jgi:hypothetical protein